MLETGHMESPSKFEEAPSGPRESQRKPKTRSGNPRRGATGFQKAVNEDQLRVRGTLHGASGEQNLKWMFKTKPEKVGAEADWGVQKLREQELPAAGRKARLQEHCTTGQAMLLCET